MPHSSITQTAKKYGRTVHQMKQILIDEGLLHGTDPTERALETGAAIIVPVNAEAHRFGSAPKSHYAKWNTECVAEIMAARGEQAGDRRIVHNRWAGVTALEKIGELLLAISSRRSAFAVELYHSGHAGRYGLRILGADWDGLLTTIRNDFKYVRRQIAKNPQEFSKEKQQIAAWLDAIEAFLIRQGAT